MKINIKSQLTNYPNYLIIAVLLAEEGEISPLVEIAGSEREAFRLLQNARVYKNHMKLYKPEDFPISISPNGEITKMPERIAGFILAGRDWFWAMNSPFPGVSYNEDWLKSFSASTFSALKEHQTLVFSQKEVASNLALPVSPKLGQSA